MHMKNKSVLLFFFLGFLFITAATMLSRCSDWGIETNSLVYDEIYPFPPNKKCDNDNLALNTQQNGYPTPEESDRGWGEGTNKWHVVDGYRTYGYWGNGLAFCGGKDRYCGEACGWRSVIINFGRTVTFNRIIVWHHNLEHTPNVYKIEYLDGATNTYKTIFETTEGRNYMWIKAKTYIPGNWNSYYEHWWEDFSIPVENTFPPVTTSKLRYSLNNCDITHGWIYEVEVYNR